MAGADADGGAAGASEALGIEGLWKAFGANVVLRGIDLSVAASYLFKGIFYVALAIWGGWRLWREKSALAPAVLLLFGYLLLRTAFLTTLETPEPRYVLVCFPAILALAGQVFTRSVRLPEFVKRSTLADYFSSTGSG